MINYYLITKPGILFGNLVTMAAGFLLASRGHFHLTLFFMTFFGLAFIMASACVFNNYIDRKIDMRMERTKNRALVIGLIPERNAIFFATLLAVIGHLILFFYTNLLTVGVAGIGFFVYVVLYSMWKSRTVYGTAIGSVAGAIPPVVGYCAVSDNFDAGALILFIMMVFWQMPHFFSIALYRIDDYASAGIPVLPLERGVPRTKIHMFLYIVGFIASAMMLTVFNYTGYLYLAVTVGFALAWLGLALIGFQRNDNKLWGCQMFKLSLALIMATCLVIPFDVV